MSKEEAATQMKNVTVYECMGALEVVKAELMEALANLPRKKDDEKDGD